MVVTIYNSNHDNGNYDFDNYIDNLTNVLAIKQNHVNTYVLRDMDIRQCVGCFGCLVKTPGCCIYKDDMAQMLRTYIDSDIVVFASPVVMGFVNATLKKFIDRLMPLFHAYLRIHSNIFYHCLRYKRYPKILLLLDHNSDYDVEDIEIIDSIFRQKELYYSKIALTDKTVENIVHEISNL